MAFALDPSNSAIKSLWCICFEGDSEEKLYMEIPLELQLQH